MVRVVNREAPEENCLWFSSASFHTLDEWFVNEIEKSIIKNYFKKDLMTIYKIK